MLPRMAEAVVGSMAADLEGSTAAGSTAVDFMRAVSMAAGFMRAVSTAAGFMRAVSTAAGFITVDLEAFAVASACSDGPITRTHTGGIIIRTTVTAGADTATRRSGITVTIPPVITLM